MNVSNIRITRNTVYVIILVEPFSVELIVTIVLFQSWRSTPVQVYWFGIILFLPTNQAWYYKDALYYGISSISANSSY